MKKVLPICEPVFKSYIYEACLSTIIGLIPNTSIWLSLKRLALYEECETNEIRTFNWDLDINFIGNIPFLKRETVEIHEFEYIMKDKKYLIQCIKNSICKGEYIYSCFEEYYVPGLLSYQKNKYVHDFLIYGFNDDLCEINILTYTAKRQFESIAISYDNLYLAMKENYDKRFILKCKPQICSYDISLYEILGVLSKYLYSTRNISGKAFNIRVNNILLKAIKDKNGSIMDLRMFRIILEQKNALLNILQILSDVYPLLDYHNECDMLLKIINDSKLLNLLALKSAFKTKISTDLKMLNIIKRIYAIEKEVLESSISKLLSFIERQKYVQKV